MAASILILAGLLAIGYLGVRAATWLRIPHSVFLVLAGVLCGQMLRGHFPEVIQALTQRFPEVVLYVLLPPLVFEAAFQLDFDRLKRDVVPISALSIAALLVSTLLIGYGLHWFFGLPLLPSLTFGALISATDPVAVVALFREVGAPERLSTLIEGESLFNDGTAMVLFRILLSASLAGHLAVRPLLASGVGQFAAVSVGSVGLGLVMAALMSLLLRLVSRSGAAQLGITLVSAYTCFIVADAWLGLSGVITCLVVGLYFGKRVRIELNREALKGIRQVWELLALSANILVFFAVGLTVRIPWLSSNLGFIPVTLLITYVARVISIFLTIPAVNRLGFSRVIDFRYQAILMWGGLRGGLALGLVLMLPPGFPNRELFVALAAAVVLVSLVINALTTRRVLGLLDLDQLSPADRRTLGRADAAVHSEVYSALNRIGKEEALSRSLVDDHERWALDYRRRRVGISKELDPEAELRFEVYTLLAGEREQYETRMSEGTLSKGTYRELSRSILAREAAFGVGRISALEAFRFERFHLLRWPERLLFSFRSRSADRLLPALVNRLELILHLRSALESSRDEIGREELKSVYGRWIEELRGMLKDFYVRYAHYSGAVQSWVISDAAFAIAMRLLDRMLAEALIDQPVFAKLKQEVEEIHRETRSRSRQLLRASGAYLVGRIPLFRQVPKVVVRALAEASPVRVVSPGQIVVREGERNGMLLVLVAGVLRPRAIAGGLAEKRFFPGDHFGIRALLIGEAQRLTLVAEVTSEILEIQRSMLDTVLQDYTRFVLSVSDPELLSDSADRL